MIEGAEADRMVPRASREKLDDYVRTEISGLMRAFCRELADRIEAHGDCVGPFAYVGIVEQLEIDIRNGVSSVTDRSMVPDLTGLENDHLVVLGLAGRAQLPKIFGKDFSREVGEIFDINPESPEEW